MRSLFHSAHTSHSLSASALFHERLKRAALSVKTQICCFSNFTCKYSRNHSTIVFILFDFIRRLHDYKFLCSLTSWKRELFILMGRVSVTLSYSWYIQWGKKVFSQPPIVQVLPLKKMREACNFHHMYTSTMRDKIRKKNPENHIVGFFKEFICKLWWKISIWSITKFHLNTLLYTLCWQWQRSNVFCKSSQGFHTLLLVFWPIPPCRSPLEQWCFGAVAGQHGLSTPSKDFLWGWDLETG